jgi:hypothetical protein
MKIFSIVLVLLLTACAKPPEWLAHVYDQNDPCQKRAELTRPPGYQIPNFCGSGRKSLLIYNQQGQYTGYIKTTP